MKIQSQADPDAAICLRVCKPVHTQTQAHTRSSLGCKLSPGAGWTCPVLGCGQCGWMPGLVSLPFLTVSPWKKAFLPWSLCAVSPPKVVGAFPDSQNEPLGMILSGLAF